MLTQTIHKFLFLLCLISMAACNPTKYLAEEEYLHAKNKIEVHQEKENYKEAVNKAEVRAILKPKANRKFLGTRIPQGLYYKIMQDGDTTNLEKVMLSSFAQEPILLDSSLVEESNTNIQNYLFNNGYFSSEVESEITVKNQLSTATYTLYPNEQHTYGSVQFSRPDSVENLEEILADIEIEEFVRPGEPYDVNDFQRLRTEIVNNAQQRGFYKFSKSSVYIDPDTLNNDQKVDIYAVIENNSDSLFNQKYYIRNIYTKLGRGNMANYTEPVMYNNKLFANSEIVQVRPKVLDRFILLQKDSLYSKREHLNTINKFYDLPIVSYANIEFNEIRQNDSLYLDAFITANTNSLMSVRFEPTISEFQGPAISADLGFEHRNIFHGGEDFEFTIGGGFESAQTAQSTRLFGTSYIDVEPKITLPRLLGLDEIYPDTYASTSNQSTSISGRFGYQDRAGLYQLVETSLTQTWDWQSSPHNRHNLSLVDISLIRTPFISDYYNEILDQYPSNRYSFEDRLILASSYTYSYSNRLKRPERNFYNFSGTFETAGNLPYLLFGNKGDTLQVNNNAIARYVRGVVDFEYNFNVTDRSNFVTRLNAGMAFPIGAIESVPAVKQFFAGGSNSMRAWRARSLGPGTFDYRELETYDEDQLVDQRGDIKLELNGEYRFPVTKLFGQQLEGALFTDVGNIWAINEPDGDAGREGAEFTEQFYKQIAVGSGLGIRLKIQNFFSVRTDLSFKMRDPVLPEGNRWVNRPFQFSNSNLTIGIGYPFFNY